MNWYAVLLVVVAGLCFINKHLEKRNHRRMNTLHEMRRQSELLAKNADYFKRVRKVV